MRVAKTVLVLLTCLLPAGASAWSTQGGRTLEPGHYALEVAAGFPDVRIAVHVPLQRHLEVGPFLSFRYFGDVTDEKVQLGNAIGARLKLNVVDRGAFQMALLAQPALMVSYRPDVLVGIQVSFPELILAYDVLPNLQIYGGFKFPVMFVFDTDYRVEIRLPLLADIGMEWGVTQKITIFLTADVGPAWTFGAKNPKWENCDKTNPAGWVCDPKDRTRGNRLGVFASGLLGITFAL